MGGNASLLCCCQNQPQDGGNGADAVKHPFSEEVLATTAVSQVKPEAPKCVALSAGAQEQASIRPETNARTDKATPMLDVAVSRGGSIGRLDSETNWPEKTPKGQHCLRENDWPEDDNSPARPEHLERLRSAIAFYGVSFPTAEDIVKAEQSTPCVSTSASTRIQHQSSADMTPSARSTGMGDWIREMSRKLTRSIAPSFVLARPNFQGHWVCKATWGLDEFLQGCGFGRLQRMAAAQAPWPVWDFEQDGDNFKFTNHSMVGKLEEQFTVDGSEYTAIDGRKQTLKCRATWEGDSLVIERDGPQGKFREVRVIDDNDELHFTLYAVDPHPGLSWGRTFQRA